MTRLEQLRTDAGLTASQLGRQVGVSNVTILNIESGKTVARPATLKRIADFFQVPASDLCRDALPVQDRAKAAA